ncbi:MAG: DUF1492 domain-containing protein [Clostridiales bacterium]|nr:DUF1492 domain-containing protein [Clostridiales bacterium]
MQVFPREVTGRIANQFYAYYERKTRKRMTLRDAALLIDFVAGPAPGQGSGRLSDITAPRVSGGGRVRPGEVRIERMLRKYMCQAENDDAWDQVFDDLIGRYNEEPDMRRFIQLTFRDRLSDLDICEKLHIGRTTFYKYRLSVLSQAGILAVQKSLLVP